jgi:hypothetical protein
MANAAGLYLDANLAWPRRRNFPFNNFKSHLWLWKLAPLSSLPFCICLSCQVDVRWFDAKRFRVDTGLRGIARSGTHLQPRGLRASGKDSYTGGPLIFSVSQANRRKKLQP